MPRNARPWLGTAPLSRATLSNSSRLSSGERHGPKIPWNGMTGACVIAGSAEARSRARLPTNMVTGDLSACAPQTTAADHSGTAELCSVIPQRDGDFRVT